MALPHDLRDCELRSFVETPPAPRAGPDNATAQRVVLSDANGALLDYTDGSLSVEQGPPGPITSPWLFALVDPITRLWATVAPGTDPQRGALVTNSEGLKATYTGVVNQLTPGTTATDFVVLTGAPNKVVRVTRVEISARSASLAEVELFLIKRSTADSGGTAGTNTGITAHDSLNPTAQGSFASYTTSPTTLGATVGTLRQTNYVLVSTTPVAGAPVGVLIWDFAARNEQAVVLRGAQQQLCLNQNSAAVVTTMVYDVAFTWTEE